MRISDGSSDVVSSDLFEGVGVAQRLRLRGDATLHGRVAAIAQYRLGRVAFRARVEQRHRGVGAEGERLLRGLALGVPAVGIIHPPMLSAGGCDEKIELLGVGELVRGSLWLRGLDLRLIKHRAGYTLDARGATFPNPLSPSERL